MQITATLKNAVLWDVAPCRSCVNRRFVRLSSVCNHLFTLVPRLQIFLPWIWRWYIPPKRRFTQDLHGAVSQKKVFSIVTYVKTSDLTTATLLSDFMQIQEHILVFHMTALTTVETSLPTSVLWRYRQIIWSCGLYFQWNHIYRWGNKEHVLELITVLFHTIRHHILFYA
jgi:hypothetical protein